MSQPQDVRAQHERPSSRPLACAIILNYFGAAMTGRCVAKLGPEGLSRIIVADNSADSVEWKKLQKECEELRPQLAGVDVVLVQSPRNLGFGKAINAAIHGELDHGRIHPYFLLINNDAEAKPGCVPRLIAALEHNPHAALASPAIESLGTRHCFRWYKRFFGHHTTRPLRWAFPYLTGCCLLVRGSVAAEEPLFDEAFFMYGEDIDLSWRQTRKGRPLLCIEDAVVVHEGRGSTGRVSFFYEYHLNRGQLLLARRAVRHKWEIPAMLLGRLCYLGARAAVRSLRFRSATPLAGFVASWSRRRVSPEPNSVAEGASGR